MRIRRRPRRAVSAARRRFDWRDDRGVSSSVEQLFAFVFLLMLFLFFMQVIVWWHAKNILEQSAAEGARAAAAADGGCTDAATAATSIRHGSVAAGSGTSTSPAPVAPSRANS